MCKEYRYGHSMGKGRINLIKEIFGKGGKTAIQVGLILDSTNKSELFIGKTYSLIEQLEKTDDIDYFIKGYREASLIIPTGKETRITEKSEMNVIHDAHKFLSHGYKKSKIYMQILEEIGKLISKKPMSIKEITDEIQNVFKIKKTSIMAHINFLVNKGITVNKEPKKNKQAIYVKTTHSIMPQILYSDLERIILQNMKKGEFHTTAEILQNISKNTNIDITRKHLFQGIYQLVGDRKIRVGVERGTDWVSWKKI